MARASAPACPPADSIKLHLPLAVAKRATFAPNWHSSAFAPFLLFFADRPSRDVVRWLAINGFDVCDSSALERRAPPVVSRSTARPVWWTVLIPKSISWLCVEAFFVLAEPWRRWKSVWARIHAEQRCTTLFAIVVRVTLIFRNYRR